MRSAGLALALALAFAAGCSFHDGVAPDGGGGAQQIVDDTAEDFAKGTLDGVEVDPLGWLAPEAYVNGGVHARAYAGSIVTPTMTWTELQALTLPALLGEKVGAMPVGDWPYGRPFGLGIMNTDAFTIIYDGEIYLPEGSTRLQITVDDRAFVEIDLGTTRAAIHAQVNDPPLALSVTPPRAGWYPFHAAMSDDGGPAKFQLALVGLSGPVPITADRLRARTTHTQGMLVTGVNDRLMRAPLQPGSSIEQNLIARDWSNYRYPTYDLEGLANDNYTVRYAGQLRVDAPAAYVFTLDLGTPSPIYARLLVDGKVVAGHWAGSIDQLASDPIQLTPGWHDLLLDYSKYGGGGQWFLTASVAGSVATPIAARDLRPVARSGLLVTAGVNDTGLADATDATHPGVTSIPLLLTAPEGATLDFADVFFYLSNEARTDLDVALTQTQGSQPVPLGTLLEGTWDYICNLDGLAGMPVADTWQLVFSDHVQSASAGRAQYVSLIATYHGGPGGPFATQQTYISAPHATPGAKTIDAVQVTADLHGAQLAVALRVADDETALSAAPWTDVTPGAPLPAGNVVQYRLTVISDGWQYPTIERVEIDASM